MPMEASRNNQDKPPLDYILTFPEALRAFAMVCKHGEQTYDKYNYLKSGKPLSEYVGCLLRHLASWEEGKDLDESSGQNHLGHVVWNALALCQFALDKTGIDDRPKRNKPETVVKADLDQVFQAWEAPLTPAEPFYVPSAWLPSQEEQQAKNKLYENILKAATWQNTHDMGRNPQPFERLVPRYTEEPLDLEPDKPDVEWELDPDPLAQPNEVLVRLYDLGKFRMTREDFKNRDSSRIWDTRESARLAVHSLIERGWARRVP